MILLEKLWAQEEPKPLLADYTSDPRKELLWLIPQDPGNTP
jgi:hypothetical protein